jgi:cytochrome c oxidase assembly protein subunit 15
MQERIGLFNNKEAQAKGRKWVAPWLFLGLILVLGQIMIGGITRLTDSGLSITEWEVVKGTIPPLNEAQWQETFDKYKVGAQHQFTIQNADMTLSEFKKIYFWEWFHRTWAKSMGFIFLIPFIFFLARGYFSKQIVQRLGVVILLAASAAVMGWLMVDSGIQNTQEELASEVLRTRVSAYRLIIHLVIATALIGYLWWTYLIVKHPNKIGISLPNIKRFTWLLITMLIIQILLGGLVAGTKAGVVHPHFPAFVNGDNLVKQLMNKREMNVDNFVDYEKYSSPKAWIQVSHRFTAYLLVIMVLMLFNKLRKVNIPRKLMMGNYMLISLLVIQFMLGVFTIINYQNAAPLVLGVLHQAVALILFGSALYIVFLLNNKSY